MRVLFVGDLWPGSTCVSRRDGLASLGLAIDELDTTRLLPDGPRLLRSFVQRTYMHPRVARMNRRLRDAVRDGRPDAVWVEKGEWIFPPTLTWIRRRGVALVHYGTDDVMKSHSHAWLHRLGIARYDAYLTTNRFNVLALRERYGERVFRSGMGFDPRVCRPVDAGGVEPIDVVFIGHWEPHTEEYVEALRAAGVDVRVWGRTWWKARAAWLRESPALPHDAYAQTIARARIALCSLSRWNRNESTGRSFEIPAIGTLMVAEHTDEHAFIYGDGRGAVLFRTPAELVERVKAYLADEEARRRVAAQGHAYSRDPGHSWTDHIRREWPIALRVLAGAGAEAGDDAPFWPGFRRGAPAPAGSEMSSTRHGRN